ncbi:MAG TPA: DNA polymerase I [Spirochaetia bacterium]|nr:DNA polymerase I [Spirochaetia bacterium]
MPRDVLLVIDGNSLIHRAYHALPVDLTTSGGIATNAVLGFTNMLQKVLVDLRPACLAVAMDKGKITFRHAVYKEYKATRKPTAPDLASQFPLVREVLAAMRIRLLELENYEADDIIGTLAARAEREKLPCLVLTGDRDALQLVSPTTTVFLTQKGISDLAVYDPGKVVERYGIQPAQYTDFRALTGDSSDNIPGVPGIGEKTAGKLIAAYGTLDELLARRDELSPRQRDLLGQYEQQARLSRELATISRDAPLDFSLAECRWEGPDHQSLLAVFQRLEFKKLAAQIRAQAKPDQVTAPPAGEDPVFRAVTDHGQAGDVAGELGTALATALVPAADERDCLYALGLAAGENTAVFTGSPANPNPALWSFLAGLRPGRNGLYLHHAKEFLRILTKNGLPPVTCAFDTMLAAYLLNPGQASRSLTECAADYLLTTLPQQGDAALAGGARAILGLVPVLTAALAEAGLMPLFQDMEMPLVGVLADMENTGVKVDLPRLEGMSTELGVEIARLAETIYELAGERFNLNSPRQMATILFEKLQLPAGRRTKTKSGYSTDAAVLEELAGRHEIVALILNHRQLVKLKSTYVDAMVSLIDPATGCLHTTFQQALTATGRLSSVNPNLQNVPVRLEEGRRIRKVFVPRRPGNLILTADYSQIELRLLAHMSGDENLREAFRQGEDIHTRTASEVFGVPLAEVTREMRSGAKAINFGIIYGISSFGLARNTGIEQKEAGRYIDGYFRRYPAVRTFTEETIAEARRRGYVTTIFNRRRYLPDLTSSNYNLRAAAERTAINTPLQGTAADIIKVAMIRIHRLLKEGSFKTLMVLQVHDELIFEVPQPELAVVSRLVREAMENAVPLTVPLTVDLKAGPNWYDVKSIGG